MTINLRKAPLAARFGLWFVLFLAAASPAIMFDSVASISRRLADCLCDLADMAAARGRALRERMR